jgi:hypothetical protein
MPGAQIVTAPTRVVATFGVVAAVGVVRCSGLRNAWDLLENPFMPNAIDRYKQADAAFAELHRDISPGVPRSEEEWRIYREWADATADYLQVVDSDRYAELAGPRDLDRIRKILCARVPSQRAT